MARYVDAELSATAGPDGVAQVTFVGPGMVQEVLKVDAISLRSDSATLCDCTIYRGAVTGRRIAYHQDGRAGTFRGGGITDLIGSSDAWVLQWTNVTPGATVTAALSGVVDRR